MSEDDLERRAQGRVGTVLCGKYRIERVLGVGGMAAVYAATHRNQRRVAIKMLHPELTIHADVRARFLREGYAANSVDDPGAVAVLDDDTAEDGSAFLVMERLEGEEVERLWEQQKSRFDERVVLAIADPLLGVLHAAHEKAIIHRDIKPANLYVTFDGTLKVLDFGIARVRDAAEGAKSTTRTGLMLGTPSYMAPEQALAKSSEIDRTTDIWSVGATMFALLSGQLVHSGESITSLLVAAATKPARSLREVAPHVDARVVAIVDRALAFEKSARWPDASAMRAAVREAYAAMFGVRVSKEPLELLFVGTASTVAASSPAVSLPAAPPPPAPPPPAMAAPAPMSAEAAPPRHAPPDPLATAPAMAVSPIVPAVPPPPPLGGPSERAVRAGADDAWLPKKNALVLPLILIAIAGALLLTVGFWYVVRRSPSTPTSPPVTPSAEAPAPPTAEPPDAEVSSAAPPPSDTAPVTTSSAPHVITPRVAPVTPQPIKPVPTPVVPVTPATTTVAPPAPPPPIVTAPPAPAPMCKQQCIEVARSCKATCRARYDAFRDRHRCNVGCDANEHECRAHSPC